MSNLMKLQLPVLFFLDKALSLPVQRPNYIAEDQLHVPVIQNLTQMQCLLTWNDSQYIKCQQCTQYFHVFIK